MSSFYFPSDDLHMNIARGLVRGTSHIHKFGAVDSLSTATTGTVWDVDDTVYPWTAFATPGTIVLATNVAENGKKVVIEGLDTNFDNLSEEVTISAGAATTSGTFARVFRAYISEGTTNTNDITLSRGGTTIAVIRADAGQTLMAIYTIPNGHTGYMTHMTTSCQQNADGTGNMYVRYNTVGVAFRIAHTYEVSGTGGTHDYTFGVPLALPEKTDIDMQIGTRSNNGRFTSSFDIILIKNGLI